MKRFSSIMRLAIVSAGQGHSGLLRVENAWEYLIPVERGTPCRLAALPPHWYCAFPLISGCLAVFFLLWVQALRECVA